MQESIDYEKFFPPLMNAQQFTAADALAVSGLSSGQLKGILDRNQISLSLNHNPGTGRRRMFTGQDILALSVVQVAGRVGFPLRWGNVLAQQIIAEAGRMHLATSNRVASRHIGIACYPAADGEDWAFVPIIEGEAVAALPTAYQVIDVTREISQTFAKLQAIIDDMPLPDFAPPQPPKHPENDFAPRSNFMKLWEKDVSGAWRYVGLTLDETRILMEHEGIAFNGDDLTYFEGVKNPEWELILSLRARHHTARQAVCGFGDDE
jgi:hypothetical protein